ncbi:redoxin domain-containing protein [Aquabacter sp. L1I39]|uniref:redoxin domain-containing protein n=1 Tax=Aquabacter sp. L1I39 TaxID=2820278 RepID=UPI001ADB4CF4|nr:redoxin domain-containing protein [Aquabacter sp. L1I39]QTL04375.1 redoxin domain-containing protein [Aquabacter sp. L1I39]
MQDMTVPAPATALQPGVTAPDFTLPATPDQALSLSEMKGHPVILAFYPADWSPVCGDEMSLLNAVLPEFHKMGAQLVGISTDGVWCHAAFAAERKLHFPLLADFEPKGETARRYGVYRPVEGVADRALFVIDAQGVIRWSYVSPLGINPGADGILEALDKLAAHPRAEGAAA